MQFNPFHPMAYHLVKTIENLGNGKYKGVYEWNLREYDFVFDIQDKRYRIHSDVWQGLIGTDNTRYLMYDIVSDHDISEVF